MKTPTVELNIIGGQQRQVVSRGSLHFSRCVQRMIREGFTEEGDTICYIFSQYNLQVGEELQTLPLL